MQSTEVINYPRPGLVVSGEEDNPDTSQATDDRDSNSAEEESYSNDGETHQLHGINERENTRQEHPRETLWIALQEKMDTLCLSPERHALAKTLAGNENVPWIP
jgi:hypothetical protein